MQEQIITTGDYHYANARWLIQLRWVAVVGQIATIFGAIWLFQMRIPMAWAMLVVIALTIVSNLFLTQWFQRWRRIDQQLNLPESTLPWNPVLGLVLIMDIFSLTALLFTTGGPNNPFCLFFFVNLSLSALLLNRQWAWGINVLTFGCFLLLMLDHHPNDHLNLGLTTILGTGTISLEQLGFLASFATCASVIVYFMTRLSELLRAHQAEIRAAQQLQANSDKVEALGTLAAGTAHELATPLSTIAIVARDVEQAFEKYPPDFPGAEDVIEDVHLIRSQLDRCRRIIDRMSSHAGETIGESIELTSIDAVTRQSLEGIIEHQRVELLIPESIGSKSISVPRDAFCQAMRGLIQNAIDADPAGRPVRIEVTRDEREWLWTITDQGQGMSPDQLKRISEPFYTTKAPGKGMGLGVFLAMNVVNRLGGSVEFSSEVNVGTTASVRMPVSS